MIQGFNQPVAVQIRSLRDILMLDHDLWRVIERVSAMQLPNLYIGGGSVAQSVWNVLFGQPVGNGISDIDVIYFDDDLSESKERQIRGAVANELANVKYEIDVNNEARVHLWYHDYFGVAIEPYESTEDAINSWPSTATSIGVYLDEHLDLQVFAPCGMNDLFSGIVRPNKNMISEQVFLNKSHKWQNKWPGLQVINWWN